MQRVEMELGRKTVALRMSVSSLIAADELCEVVDLTWHETFVEAFTIITTRSLLSGHTPYITDIAILKMLLIMRLLDQS